MTQVMIPRWSLYAGVMVLVAALAFSLGGIYTARGENHDQTFYACLYAGSFSQINTTVPPANCGRGTQVQWTSAAPFVAPQVTIRSADHDVAQDTWRDDYIVDCLFGEVATGGGALLDFAPNDLEGTFPIYSLDAPTIPVGWAASVNSFGSGDTGLVTVYAVCMAWDS